MTYLIFTTFLCVSPLLGWGCKDTQQYKFDSYDECMAFRSTLIKEYRGKRFTYIAEAKCLTVPKRAAK